MSAPTISPVDAPLGLRNGKFDSTNVNWVLPLGTTAILYFPVYSSGNSNPYVKVRVSWGDGSVEETDLRPVGRSYNYIHEYAEVGDYHILVEVFNTDFLTDDTGYVKTTITIRVENHLQPSRNSNISRWRGLALPKGTLQATYASVNSNPEFLITGIVSPASSGQSFIVVAQPEFFSVGSQVTITEPGKLITSARSVRMVEDIVYLDAELSDSYTVASAQVEIRGISNFIRAQSFNSPPQQDWFFPSSSEHALVQSAIRMILSTRLSERVMLPEFGSNLHEIPFEPNDPLVESLVRRYTLEALRTFEPRAEIVQFSIKRIGNDLNVSMVARLLGDNQTLPIDFQLVV
jgi:phage baseplate assembly protein W